MRFFIHITTLTLAVLSSFGPAIAEQFTPDQIVDKAAPTVAMVLVGKSPSELAGIGSAVAVREDGVLLTSYHILEEARSVQVRLKSGEVYDKVLLLGVDDRRDIAAIRISASGLPVLPIAPASQAKPGETVFLISHAAGLPWTFSSGSLSAYRMADEVPGAGSGYRLLQFTAPTSPGSSGGALIDSQGRLLGLVTGTMEGGQNLNFAVPVESVTGLAEAPVALAFDSGAQLALPAQQSAAPPPVAEGPAIPKPTVRPKDAQAESKDFTRSESLQSKDKDYIIANFRTLWIDTENAEFFGVEQMQAALAENKEFNTLNITIVATRSLADVVLEIGYTFAWDYPFSLKHENSGMILLSGKGSGPFSGPAGAASVARELTNLLKPHRRKKESKPEPS